MRRCPLPGGSAIPYEDLVGRRFGRLTVLHDELNDDGYGRTPSELRRSTFQHVVRDIEAERARRSGLNPKPRERRKSKSDAAVRAAFACAELEQRELQRLRASGRPYACLDFHPERLAAEL
jgi:hypothetical protein